MLDKLSDNLCQSTKYEFYICYSGNCFIIFSQQPERSHWSNILLDTVKVRYMRERESISSTSEGVTAQSEITPSALVRMTSLIISWISATTATRMESCPDQYRSHVQPISFNFRIKSQTALTLHGPQHSPWFLC